MSYFNTQTIAKPSYSKTKAFGLCGTLAIATAILIGAGAVSADETTQPVADTQPAASNVYTADNAGNITVTPSEVAPAETATPAVETAPVAEPTPVTETPVAQPVAETTAPVEAQPTTFVKEGDTIQVSNPNVEVDQSQGTGKYQGFTVEYKDVKFPDDMAINEGDKVKFTLPEEVKFQTNFDFDVYNPDKQVVGKATTDTASNTVTTVFNNYFASHPLNKQMSLKMDATWTDKVESGKPVTVNFNGTVITVNIGKEQEIGKDELLSKWGSQDENDPTVINWTIRVNYARRVLNYVTLIDTMSDNQTLVDNFFEVKNIESVNPWIDKGSAMDLVKSISKSEHGFEIKMDRLDHMIYLNYKTKLTNAVKDSVNPTNKVELKAESDGAVSYSYVQLVGGRGDASGENKPEPTFEIPNDAPKYELPEWHGGTTPFDAPKYDKPEWNGGTVPFDAPVYDKPSINLEDIPMMPPAPILEKPELVIEIPSEPVKPTKPSENTPNKPVDAPKEKEAQSATVSYNLDSEPKEAPNTPVYGGALPNTGEKEGIASTLGLVVIAAGITALTLGFKKYNEDK
jgi:lpxtg cell wall surface protein, collagen binding domain protein